MGPEDPNFLGVELLSQIVINMGSGKQYRVNRLSDVYWGDQRVPFQDIPRVLRDPEEYIILGEKDGNALGAIHIFSRAVESLVEVYVFPDIEQAEVQA
jgi:hypothetical protein